jgi:hypothetical protein
MALVGIGFYALLLAIAYVHSNLEVANYGSLFLLTAALWGAGFFVLKRAHGSDDRA